MRSLNEPSAGPPCYHRRMSAPTPRHSILDPQGRPYFLWDCDLTEEQFLANLHDRDADVRAATLGTLMRQAKPDDVFRYVSEAEVRESWERVQPFLGRSRAFWTWLLGLWNQIDAR